MWTHAWEKKVVGKDYEAYAQKIDQRPRDETFARVVEALYRPIERREITGNQFLNLLGRPDLWFHAADGRVLLVYFYQSAERKMESRVFVNAEGYVEQVSWEPFGGNVYGPEFHRESGS
jgi:hypothetical protein